MNGTQESQATGNLSVKQTIMNLLRRPLKLKQIKIDAVSLFCRQLATLVDAGIPLLKCLKILHQRTSHPQLQQTIQQVLQDVEQGASFSAAIEKFPAVFSPFFVNMIKVAEKGGSLDKSLKVVADVLEKDELTKMKVREALIYPMVTLLVGLLVVGLMIIVVVPMFTSFYTQANFDLPLPTKILLIIGDPKLLWVWLLLIGILGVFAGMYWKSHGTREFYDRNKLKLPIFGALFMKLYVARFCQNLGTLIQGGVPLLQSLDVVKETSENIVIIEAVEKTIQHVERGGRLEQPLREADIFPDVVVDMIAIGEEAGKLEVMLFKVAELYDGEITRAINMLTSSLQPILMVVLGLLTAFVAVSLFWPYFRLMSFFGAQF